MKNSHLLSPGVNVLIDGQFGSTGKGKLSAYLADRSDVVWNTADFQPNAGHTVVYGGKSYVTKTIPSGFVNRDARLYLTPASTINIQTLLKEIELLEQFGVADRLWIHPHAAVVTQEDIDDEKQGMQGIASTMTGGGSALRRKIARKARVAKDFEELRRWISDKTQDICHVARAGGIVLAETAQGFDLSLNHGMQYPYVTSRDVTTASVLSNLGVPPRLMSRCWASMRTYPIRVGHLFGANGEKLGDSGPCYLDQRELDWKTVTALSGSKAALLEMTTVTKRVRRIFTWSDQQYAKFLNVCQPTDVFLNFANYLDDDISGFAGRNLSQAEIQGRWPNVRRFLTRMHEVAVDTVGGGYAPAISLLGTGARNEEMIELSGK